MPILVSLIIMISVYVAKNEKLGDQSRNGWFLVLAIVGGLTVILSLLF